MKFSPSQLAFYLPKLEAPYIRNNNWPDDLIDLTNDEITTFVKLSPPKGMKLGVNEVGRPYFVEIALPTKQEQVAIEKSWRDGELDKVLNRIDQYEKDQNYPVELRTSPIKSTEDFLLLLNDRKVLSDYPETQGFPFGSRPTLSDLY